MHWQQIGHILDRPAQLPLDGIRPSGGLYAPTIRHHAGLFYVINTLVDGLDKKGNFIVTAHNPAGPWSQPNWLDDAPGIDPSLFFDDDGKAWYCGNRIPPSGERYPGHREIWLQELDLKIMQLTGPNFSLWDGALKGNLHAEAPHIYKRNGFYYLLIAEAGTGHNHAVTIARARDITGPYINNHRNPILTHRHLGLDYPIVGTGHADLVVTQNDEWWMVCLAMRPYDGYFYNLGRETFLVPVVWEEDWPVVAPHSGKVTFTGNAPNLPNQHWSPVATRDKFNESVLAPHWNFLRTPREDFWSLDKRPGFLQILLRPATLMERVNPSFIGGRQAHINFSASLAIEFTPGNQSECAGLVLLQNDDFQIRFVVTLGIDKTSIVRLVRRDSGVDTVIFEQRITDGRKYLKVEANGQNYMFFTKVQDGKWNMIDNIIDGRVLSTPVAGGFTGTYIGMYASSNGNLSENEARFDWFEYHGK